MTPFLYQIAQLFYQHYGAKISRLVFVFPNRRAGLFFQKYLSELSDKPLFSPVILTVNDSPSQTVRADVNAEYSCHSSIFKDYSLQDKEKTWKTAKNRA